jgi:hypothetical protein
MAIIKSLPFRTKLPKERVLRRRCTKSRDKPRTERGPRRAERQNK